MTNLSASWHEEGLAAETRDYHRALSSLCEELEAVDWYGQRVDAVRDPELRAILAHNRDEEVEHATMILEWLRRNHPVFARELAARLGRPGPIVRAEDEDEDGEDRVEPASAPRDPARGLDLGALRPDAERRS